MYENVTFESILDRMLERVPDSMDKREGSIIYDALAPAAIELQLMYIEMGNLLLQVFAETADREYLVKKAKERGIDVFPATKSTIKCEFKNNEQEFMDVEIGSRFSVENLNYVVVEKISKGCFSLICETYGSVGNISVPCNLMPIDYIKDLASATVTKILKLGEDEESTEHLRDRYFAKVREPATSGNVSHYKIWTMEVPGVGGVKAFPLHNGAGTVKLIITDNKMQVASSELIQNVKNHIEEVRPIGATVTVESALKKDINVSAKIKFVKSVNLQTIKSKFIDEVKSYFKKISFNTNYISIAKIGSILLSIDDVLDYDELKLNSQNKNIELSEYEIPYLLSVELDVIS